MSVFPASRLRRLRRTDTLRAMVRETALTPGDFILPFFVTHGRGVRDEVGAMPGVYQLSVDELVRDVRELPGLGIPAVLLFGLPAAKDPYGREAYAPDGIVQQAMRAIKDASPDTIVVGDVCLCEYTDHGHCGVVEDGQVLNDPTLELLAEMAVVQAQAGADVIAPSDMMDGRVGAIRRALDEYHFADVPIMAYSAKFASGFYGPFREAADSAPQFGDRRSYQMDGANIREAMREIELDLEEGADMIMVKPAMPYLDVIAAARERYDVPLAAYQVSGEYAMIEAAARNNWIDRDRVMMESLLSIRRAGAKIILTYFAKDASRLLA